MVCLNSYAKLNLFLVVLNKRKDGFHNIKTIFERIDLCDKIFLSNLPNKKIELTTNDKTLNKDICANLAYKSAKLLQQSFNLNKGARIRIIKRIPVGAGLGGGSSNAAFVLLGLNKLWNLSLSRKKLLSLAQKLGSDVAFFMHNISFAQGKGRGERITPLKMPAKAGFWHILVVPKIEVRTPFIYAQWDKNFGLTGACGHGILKELQKGDLLSIGKILFNSLQQITAGLYPEVRRIIDKLSELGVQCILMSGSGPAVFGLVGSRKEAGALKRQLARENLHWRTFITRTV